MIGKNWQINGIAGIRIITGLLLAYHGLELFDAKIMETYLGWDKIKVLPFPEFLTYVGKAIELAGGLLLAIGLFTRIASLLIIFDMLFICFYIGNGKFYYEDQHSFLFALLAIVFFFAGSVKFGLDNHFFKGKDDENNP
jgi:putative oxidoreductase